MAASQCQEVGAGDGRFYMSADEDTVKGCGLVLHEVVYGMHTYILWARAQNHPCIFFFIVHIFGTKTFM